MSDNNKFLSSLAKTISGKDDGLAYVLDDVDDSHLVYYDTGSYVLNALLSGSIHGGVPSNRITTFCGKSSTGKSFVLLAIVKAFLEQHKDGMVFFFESEGAFDKNTFVDRGIDAKRVLVIDVCSVEEFKQKSATVLETYIKGYPDSEDRPKALMCLDSLGQLTTEKEIEDNSKQKETRDMTRTQKIRASLRILQKSLNTANVPLLMTNHVYDTMDMFSPMRMSGGHAVEYASSGVIYLSKKYEKDSQKNVTGAIITATNNKSRFTREKLKVDMLIKFEGGLDRHYGLLDFATEADGIHYNGRQFVVGEDKFFKKHILEDPETFYTNDILKKLDDYFERNFKYASAITTTEDGSDEQEDS